MSKLPTSLQAEPRTPACTIQASTYGVYQSSKIMGSFQSVLDGAEAALHWPQACQAALATDQEQLTQQLFWAL